MCRPSEETVYTAENQKDAAHPKGRDERIANFGFLLREWMVLNGAEKFELTNNSTPRIVGKVVGKLKNKSSRLNLSRLDS